MLDFVNKNGLQTSKKTNEICSASLHNNNGKPKALVAKNSMNFIN